VRVGIGCGCLGSAERIGDSMSKKTDKWREALSIENETFWLSRQQFVGLPEKFQELCAGTPFEGSRLVLTGAYEKKFYDRQAYRSVPATYQVALLPSVESYEEIPGHRFVGYCQSEGADWVVHSLDRSFEFTPEIISELVPERCDVCGHRRARKRLFCLVEKESGKLVIVGGSCAKKFRGVNLERLLSKLLFPITKLIAELGETLGWLRPPIEDLIAKAEIIVAAWGFVSKGESEQENTVATSYWLNISNQSPKFGIGGDYDKDNRQRVLALYEENRAQLEAREKELRETGCKDLIDYLEAQKWSQFNHNCIAYLRNASEKVSWGFLAFFGSISARAAETLKKNKHPAWKDEPVTGFKGAPVGKVADFGEFRVLKTQWRSNHFGDNLCFTCVNDKNERLWFKVGESSAAY